MGGISLWHILLFLIVGFAVFWPVAMILRKAGYSGWWCLIFAIPLIGYIGLWVFASAKWPNLKQS